MKIFEPRFQVGIAEQSNAAGSRTLIIGTAHRKAAQPFSEEQADKIKKRSGTYSEQDARWYGACGVKVEEDFRRFLIGAACHIANRQSTFADCSEFFKTQSENKMYGIQIRALQRWRDAGAKHGYFTVTELQNFGQRTQNGSDLCIYFDRQQKEVLLKATGAV